MSGASSDQSYLPEQQKKNSSNESLQVPPQPSGSETTDDMLHILTEYRENGLFCDVTLKIDSGEHFRAHRAVLAVSSPFFRALFSHHKEATETTTDQQQIVHIPGISLEMIKLVLQHCYTRRCKIDESNVEQLLPLADRFFIPSLKERCCKFLANQLHIQNCIGIWRFSRFYNCQDLNKNSYRYLLKHFPVVSVTGDEWLHLTIEELGEICRDDHLNCNGEEQVFSAIYRWLVFDQARQRNEEIVTDLFRTIRLDLLSIRFLRETIENNRLVQNNRETLALYMTNYRRRLGNNSKNVKPVDLDTLHFSRLRIPHEILLAVGGWTGRQPNDIIEAYDVRAKRWHILDARIDNGPRAYHSCVTINGQELYVIGGYNGIDYFNSVRKWNIVTGVWKEVAPMNSRRCYVAAVNLSGFVMVFGGFDGHVRTNTAESYNPTTNQWSYIRPMNYQRSDAGAAVLNGYAYICGGFNGTTCMDTVERYDPVADQWTNVAPMTSRRSGVSIVAYHGYLYALGGFNGRNRVETVERYFPTQDVWRQVGSMKTPRSNFAVAVIDDQLFVIGGYHNGETMPNVETYSAATNQWTEAVPMNRNRSALSALVLTDLPNIEQFLRRDFINSDTTDDGEDPGYATADDEETDEDIANGDINALN